MSTTNISEFTRDWNAMGEQLGILPAQLLRKIAFDLYRNIVGGDGDSLPGTPVDTGRARANWFVSTGAPSSEVIGDSREQAEKKARGEVYPTPEFPASIGIDGTAPVFIVNNLPYIERLENGHSMQAPNGMVHIALEKLDLDLDRELNGESK